MHPALGQGFSNHLDAGSYHLGSLCCLHLGLHLLHLGLHLLLLDHHRSTDKFQLLLGSIQHWSREALCLRHQRLAL